VRKPKLKILIVGMAAFCVLSLSVIAFADWRVSQAVGNAVFSKAEDVPEQEVALLLGTAPTVGEKSNFFYVERLKATTQLWRLGKIRAVLISGDNSRTDYNEPEQMKQDLVTAGIPAEYITCDYAGLRTLDSVSRANKVFGLQGFVVVSQRKHVERALYLASEMGLRTVGLAAQDAPKWWQVRQHLREALARVKAMIDLSTGRQPRHLGAPVAVKLAPRQITPTRSPAK